MAARHFLTSALARTVFVLVALLVSSNGATTGSLAAQVPEADGARAALPGAALDGHEEPVADRPDRPVLTNAAEIVRRARKRYRALDVNGSLGEGSVLLRLKVEPDGSVSDARIVGSGPHHPTLNALARRVAHQMVFSPPPREDGTRAGGLPRWIDQRISFVR